MAVFVVAGSRAWSLIRRPGHGPSAFLRGRGSSKSLEDLVRPARFAGAKGRAFETRSAPRQGRYSAPSGPSPRWAWPVQCETSLRSPGVLACGHTAFSARATGETSRLDRRYQATPSFPRSPLRGVASSSGVTNLASDERVRCTRMLGGGSESNPGSIRCARHSAIHQVNSYPQPHRCPPLRASSRRASARSSLKASGCSSMR